jgi:cyclopropane fatty-acyl-phospholipid synthase-like methyltransferase
MSVLDAGCGEGKNAVYLAKRGAKVTAVEISSLALENAEKNWAGVDGVTWINADIRKHRLAASSFDVVVSYGLLHCLNTESEVRRTLRKLKAATKPGGFLILCVFNDRQQDLSAHPGFEPCLLPHKFYEDSVSGWQTCVCTDNDLVEKHPHNNVRHSHSMTRILAQRMSAHD